MVRKSRMAAFTLVELLVVIGVICLLMSILMPALSTAREMSRKVYCQANMKAMGNGIVQYISNNNEITPPVMYGPDHTANSHWMWRWADMIVKYFDSEATICRNVGGWVDTSVLCQPLEDSCVNWFRSTGVIASRYYDCPTLRIAVQWGGQPVPTTYTVDYAWNFAEVYSGNDVGWCYYPSYGGAAGNVSAAGNNKKWVRKTMHFGSPSELCAAMESGYADAFDMAGAWGHNVNGVDVIQCTILGTPHMKTLNQVFYDGHVGNISAAKYLDYTSKPDDANTKSYPFYCQGMPAPPAPP